MLFNVRFVLGLFTLKYAAILAALIFLTPVWTDNARNFSLTFAVGGLLFIVFLIGYERNLTRKEEIA